MCCIYIFIHSFIHKTHGISSFYSIPVARAHDVCACMHACVCKLHKLLVCLLLKNSFIPLLLVQPGRFLCLRSTLTVLCQDCYTQIRSSRQADEHDGRGGADSQFLFLKMFMTGRICR